MAMINAVNTHGQAPTRSWARSNKQEKSAPSLVPSWGPRSPEEERVEHLPWSQVKGVPWERAPTLT